MASYAKMAVNQNFSTHPGHSNVHQNQNQNQNQNQDYLASQNTAYSRGYPNDPNYANQRSHQQEHRQSQHQQQHSHPQQHQGSQHQQGQQHRQHPQNYNQQHSQQNQNQNQNHQHHNPHHYSQQGSNQSSQPIRNIQSGNQEHSSQTSQSINRQPTSQQSTLPSQPISKQNTHSQSTNVSSSHQHSSSNTQPTQTHSSHQPSHTSTQHQQNQQPHQHQQSQQSQQHQPQQQQHQPQQQQQQQQQQNTNQQTPQQPHAQNQSSPHSTSRRPISSNDTLIMYYGTKYEVKCDETFAYYEGYVVDYDINERRFQVMYDWKPVQYAPANYIRPLAPSTEKWWKPKINEQIECQARAEESEPFGWWGCTVQSLKNNLCKIVFDGWDTNDIMSLEALRPKNKNPSFTDTGLTRHALKLTQEQENWVTSNTEQLSRIATKTGLIHLGYRPDLHQLVLIGLKRQIDDGKLLLEHIWEIQNLYADKEEKWTKEEQKIQEEYDKLNKCVRLTFAFDTHLTGFIIGKDGKHILAAKKIPGVEHINVKDLKNGRSECLILATDREAAEEAREHLEMEMAIERIPRSVLADLIGPGGENISKLEQSATVSLISTLAHYKKKIEQDTSYEYNPNEEEVDMVIVGPKINVAVARSALQSEVKTIAQRKQFVQRSQSARTQLKKFQKDDVSAQYDYEQDYNNQQDDGNNQRSMRRQQRDQSKRQYGQKREYHGGYNEQSYSQVLSGGGNGGNQTKQNSHQHQHTHEQKTDEKTNDQNNNQDNDYPDYGDDGDINNTYDENVYDEHDENINYDDYNDDYNGVDENVDQDADVSGEYNYQAGQQRGGYHQRGGNQRSTPTKKVYVKKQSGDTNA